ncbi:hypothetical protein FACS1894122_04220 [Alphaproteobacteria bacterium]|nr:hypothetical protein FACS1894122_04220 [Alphaproteobacteria bacterium]
MKIIKVAFSYVILSYGGVCASEMPHDICVSGLDKQAQERLSAFRTVADEIKKQTSIFNDTIYKVCDELIGKLGDNPSCGVSNGTVKELVQAANNIQKRFFIFNRDVRAGIKVDFLKSIDDILWIVCALQEKSPDITNSDLELIENLREKTKQLNLSANVVKDQIRVLPTKLEPAEVEEAKRLYREISGLTNAEINKYIHDSETLMIRSFGSTKRFEEILLGTGGNITKNERMYWHNLFGGRMPNALKSPGSPGSSRSPTSPGSSRSPRSPRSMSYSYELGIVGYPVFKSGVRSFIRHLVRVYERDGTREDRFCENVINTVNELNRIYCGENKYEFLPPNTTENTSSSSSSGI